MSILHIPFITKNNFDFITSNDYNFFVKTETDEFMIEIYKNSAENNRLDKTDYISYVGTYKCVARDGFSLIQMSLTLELDTIPNFNYVYIPLFNRYYFVEDISNVVNNIWEISLLVDVLMSYKEAIKTANAYITRNEYNYDLSIVDDKIPLKCGEIVTTDFVTNNLFDVSDGHFVLQGLSVKIGDYVG